MNLRLKTLALVFATFVVSAAALLYFASSITLGSYAELETQSANRDLERLEKVFLADLKGLFSVLEDFASWDDTYDFVATRDADYVQSNFSTETFSVPGIELILIVNSDGEVIHQSSHGASRDGVAQTLALLGEELSLDGDLFEDHPEEFGLITIGSSTLMIAMAPILKSDDGGPSRGIMLVGREFDERLLKELKLRTQLEISFENILLTTLPAEQEGHIDTLIDQLQGNALSLVQPPHLLVPVDDNTLTGNILMPDIFGDPLLLWTVTIPRDIHMQGQKSLTLLLAAMAMIGAVLIGCVVLLLERLVLRRVARLGEEVTEIGHRDDLSVRVHVDGTDELGKLGSTVNWMLDQLETSKARVVEEHERAENLLLNILPASIAQQLKSTSEPIAHSHEEVSVLFADLAGFTPLSAKMSPVDLVSMLNDIFSRYDELAHALGLEKIKTIGDAYMVAAGLPVYRDDHAEAIADMALGMISATEEFSRQSGTQIRIRIGINTGNVVAGVIGRKKFIYDLWGDTVNIASRMESSGETGMIQVSEASYRKLKGAFDLEERGLTEIKGRGKMKTYVLKGRLPAETAAG